MIRKALDFILFGSIFISLCAVALCIETNLLLGLPLSHFSFYLFVFGGTLAQYNLHYLVKNTAEKNSERLNWSLQNKRLHRILIVVGICLCIYSLFYFTIYHFIFLAVMAFVAFLYSYPALPFKEKKRLKDYGLLKIITLALLWTLVTVWFPVDQSNITGISFQIIFIRRFIFMFVLCLLFDIRDVQTDLNEKRGTIPVVIGINKAYTVCYLLLGLMVILSIYQLYLNNHFPHFNAMLLSALATAFIIRVSKRIPSDYTYLAAIDGMMLLQAALVAIGSI